MWLAMLLVSAVLLGIGLAAIAPRERPVVTVYMQRDCGTCTRWMKYLESKGFETQIGDEADWPAVRAKFRVMPGFESAHTAVVDGLYVEGPVPSLDIHRALRWRERLHLRGLVVPGVPRGSPGNPSWLPQPYTVFAVREGGIMSPFAIHDHDIGGSG